MKLQKPGLMLVLLFFSAIITTTVCWSHSSYAGQVVYESPATGASANDSMLDHDSRSYANVPTRPLVRDDRETISATSRSASEDNRQTTESLIHRLNDVTQRLAIIENQGHAELRSEAFRLERQSAQLSSELKEQGRRDANDGSSEMEQKVSELERKTDHLQIETR